MQRYIETARRYRWVLAAVLGIVWGAGIGAAAGEYVNTYESQATVWVQRTAQQISVSQQNPSNLLFQTPASEQAELFNELLQTTSFLSDVIARTSLGPTFADAIDQRPILDDVRKRFRVEVLGTNMIRISFRARNGAVAAETVAAALAVRTERVANAQASATATAGTIYARELEQATAQATAAQKAYDAFVASHNGPMKTEDDQRLAQLRTTLDAAQARVTDIRARVDQASLAPAVLEMVTPMDFQVVDPPREEPRPSGGIRPAATVGGLALLGGAALAALLILAGTHLIRPRVPEIDFHPVKDPRPATVEVVVPPAPALPAALTRRAPVASDPEP